MSFFEDVESAVKGFESGGVRARDFRLAMAETVQSALGIGSNRRGSPYEPLTVSDASGGSMLVRWSDGLVSRGSLTRAPMSALQDVLQSAFEGRYEDPDVVTFPEAADLPEVELFSEETARIAKGELPQALPEMLSVLEGVREQCGARLLDASARAVRIHRKVITSGGFRGEGDSTSLGFYLGLDSLAFDGFDSRTPLSAEEVGRRAAWTAADFTALEKEAEAPPRGKTTVVLHPRTAESFLRTFLFGSLSGSAVANGRSRFSLGDFQTAKAAFREDFSVKTRPFVPMGVGSFLFTDEGLVAREVDLIRDGALVTPLLGLKYAHRLGMAPTPTPGSIDGYEFSLATRMTREEALSGPGRRVLVHSVMGMHTQDAVRGEYSLLAPQGVLYEDGDCRGRITATLNGSFFEDLRSPDLCLVDFEGFSCPGLMFDVGLS